MRRTTMTLMGALMLTGCFGAPQQDLLFDDEAAVPVPATIAAVTPVTTDAGSGSTDGGTDSGDSDTDTGTDDDAGDDGGDDAKPSDKEAARFLMQAAFGIAEADRQEITAFGFERWMERQAALPVRSLAARIAQMDDPQVAVAADLFWEAAVEGDDQLRQRVAFALGQIVVASTQDAEFIRRTDSFMVYADILQRQALGNYEDLIREVALTPAMGIYLSHLGNEKADPERGTAADENFARELMQLFTIGLVELTPGGEPTGTPTYAARDVAGLARVFTGFYYPDTRWGHRPTRANAMRPMVGVPEQHDAGEKTFLGHTVPAGLSPEQSVDDALTHLLAHPNVGPFVTRQLIQRLVTSNPSTAYVERVAGAYDRGRFESDTRVFGTGRRGDMQAVVAAILLDEEARTPAASPTSGKVRSPLLRFAHFARTFRDANGTSWQGVPAHTRQMRYSDSPGLFGQRAYGAPSVFGYSRPGYAAPGSWTAGAGLAAPELTHAAGASMIGYVNLMRNHIEEKGTSDFFAPDYAALVALADDPDALVARIDLLTTAGSMEAATRRRIRDAVTALATSRTHNTPRHRVQLALAMAVTAPEYAIQR